ncbi:MAG: hypothetical protein BMS9Abin33_0144 [Gammaproteobacteria bacterium]|nr:MAG: hypothetical protein BMS9Abin33_0144 [Gammaproteobacteria bacterium]
MSYLGSLRRDVEYMKQIPFDPHTRIIDECYAVVYIPGRQRDRFSENCVEVMESMAAAKENANPGCKRYAARVVGPSRSSEGFRLYYLVEWLE